MGTIQRRERERAEVAKAILDAAEEMIVENGLAALSMRRLADAVEYSPATIYQHFENRDAIAKAVVRRGFEALFASFAPAGALVDTWERFIAMGHAYVTFGIAHPQTYRLMFMEKPEFAAIVFDDHEAKSKHDPSGGAYGALVALVMQLQSEGRLQRDRPAEKLANVVWSGLHGIVALKLACPDFPETPAEELTRMFIDMCRRGLCEESERNY